MDEKRKETNETVKSESAVAVVVNSCKAPQAHLVSTASEVQSVMTFNTLKPSDCLKTPRLKQQCGTEWCKMSYLLSKMLLNTYTRTVTLYL